MLKKLLVGLGLVLCLLGTAVVAGGMNEVSSEASFGQPDSPPSPPSRPKNFCGGEC